MGQETALLKLRLTERPGPDFLSQVFIWQTNAFLGGHGPPPSLQKHLLQKVRNQASPSSTVTSYHDRRAQEAWPQGTKTL